MHDCNYYYYCFEDGYEDFALVTGMEITGNEVWTPESNVFVSGRKLSIPDLLISKHEVTVGEYHAVVNAKMLDHFGNSDNKPVVNVNWYEAVIYCNKLSISHEYTPCYSLDGSTNPDNWAGDRLDFIEFNQKANGYRLPTEAEWEYLARGGSNFLYSGSDDISEVEPQSKTFPTYGFRVVQKAN